MTKGRALILGVLLTGAIAVTTSHAFSPAGATGVRLTAVSAEATGDAFALVIESSAPVPYVATHPDPLTVLVECRNVDISGVVNAVKPAAGGPVAAVAVEPGDSFGADTGRVRISLARPVAYHVRSDRNRIVVDFDKPEGLAAAAPVRGGGVVDPIAVLGLDGRPAEPAVARAAAALADQAPAVLTPAGQPPAAQAPAGGPPQAPERRFSGEPVSLDFQGADLRSVLRTFSEISDLNLVIDPAVVGSVDVALRDVPWDQALDIILRANKLGYIVDGTVVRIAPLGVLADEEAQRRRLAEQQALAGDLQVLTRTLSYAKAADLVTLTRSSLSQRGTVQVDPRTNTIIVTDLAERLQTVTQLLDTLDKPQPQVEIEARIVQTSRNYAKELGVQWGFSGRADPALGNTTNLAFPNSGSLDGRTARNTTSITQGSADGGSVPTAVNLPVAGATSAVGLALGSINGAFNLDVALSALENSGKARLLSTPRVSTQNNVEAEIAQGVQIPYQVVANNTVTVQFRDAALVLRVTPQITAANTVIMNISVDNGSPGQVISGVPSINTQRATTTVLVNDGETTVIGGIFQSTETSSTDSTPGLSRVPLLGWLFKHDQQREDDRELLIFITPRITRS